MGGGGSRKKGVAVRRYTACVLNKYYSWLLARTIMLNSIANTQEQRDEQRRTTSNDEQRTTNNDERSRPKVDFKLCPDLARPLTDCHGTIMK